MGMSDFVYSIINPDDLIHKKVSDLESVHRELLNNIDCINVQLQNKDYLLDTEWAQRARYAKAMRQQEAREVKDAIKLLRRTDSASRRVSKQIRREKNIKAAEQRKLDAIKVRQQLTESEDRLFIFALKDIMAKEVGYDKCQEILKMAGEIVRSNIE